MFSRSGAIEPRHRPRQANQRGFHNFSSTAGAWCDGTIQGMAAFLLDDRGCTPHGRGAVG